MEDFIAWLLISTVVLTFVCDMVARYWHLLLTLAAEGLLVALVLVVIAALVSLAWTLFCEWLEIRQVQRQAIRAHRRLDAAYERAHAEMNQIAQTYNFRRDVER